MIKGENSLPNPNADGCSKAFPVNLDESGDFRNFSTSSVNSNNSLQVVVYLVVMMCFVPCHYDIIYTLSLDTFATCQLACFGTFFVNSTVPVLIQKYYHPITCLANSPFPACLGKFSIS